MSEKEIRLLKVLRDAAANEASVYDAYSNAVDYDAYNDTSKEYKEALEGYRKVKTYKEGADLLTNILEETKMSETKEAIKVLEKALEDYIETGICDTFSDEETIDALEFYIKINEVMPLPPFPIPNRYISGVIKDILRVLIAQLKLAHPKPKSGVELRIEGLEKELQELKETLRREENAE